MNFNEICLRAGGRRRYNRQRRLAAASRRRQVLGLLVEAELTQRAIAAQLGVHESQVSRDRKWLEPLLEHVALIPLMTGIHRWRIKIAPEGWEISGG